MERLARFIKGIGGANRLVIIHAIDKSSRSVTEIVQETGLSRTLLSFHLRSMGEKGIISTRRDGLCIYCSLAIPELYDLIGEF